eukprot:COSAG01_NODE_66493_length_270_cov_0.561404_1_plen_37_part_10
MARAPTHVLRRLRVEILIMGPRICGIVGKSQSVLIMI